MKTCISWTKVGTNVIFHDHEEVLLFQIYDVQVTWCDLYWHKMYRYFEDEINIVMIKDVRHFQKYDYDVTNWSLDWIEKLTRTPSVCNQTNTKSLVFFASSFICAYALKLELNTLVL